jgi:hypothetical protein
MITYLLVIIDGVRSNRGFVVFVLLHLQMKWNRPMPQSVSLTARSPVLRSPFEICGFQRKKGEEKGEQEKEKGRKDDRREKRNGGKKGKKANRRKKGKEAEKGKEGDKKKSRSCC